MEDSFQEVNDRGRAVFPGLDLSVGALVRHAHRAQIAAPQLAAHGVDFFLVVAVLEGVPGALASFDTYLSRACVVAARVNATPEFIDDVRQELRIKLLTGDQPRLLSYAASGSLVDWLRVSALRIAINLKRSDHLVATEDLTLEDLVDPADGELLRVWYRVDFRDALETSFSHLAPRERTLLRLHFVDGLNIDQLGTMYGLHRATMARRLAGIRQRLFEDAKVVLKIQHGLNTRDIKSLYRLLEGDVHLTISRMLRP